MRPENEAFEPQWQEYMFHILCWLLALGDLFYEQLNFQFLSILECLT